MTRLAQTADLTDIQQEILSTVRSFVDKEIIPNAQELEHGDTYPQEIVDGLKELGIFGLMIPEEFGGLGESLLTYALVVEEIARGWMSVSGVINTHFIVAYMIIQHGTRSRRSASCPAWPPARCAAPSRCPSRGWAPTSPASAPRPTEQADGNYVIDGQKMWLTNGGSSTLVAALVRTDEGAEKAHQNLTTFLVEKPAGFGEVIPGLTIPGKIDKMGYKGVDTTELIFDGYQAEGRRHPRRDAGPRLRPDDGRRRGRPGQRRRARLRHLDPRLRAGHRLRAAAGDLRQADRPAPGDRVPARRDGHQGRGLARADGQGRQLKDAGERNDVEAGMAKLLASEYCAEVTTQSFRIHGGYGYSKEYEIERLMREAPFLLIGEGTSEIQKTIISRGLLKTYALKR